MLTALTYDPDLAQAIEDLSPIATELLAAAQRRDALPASTPLNARAALNESIEDLSGHFDARAVRLALEPETLLLIVIEAVRLAKRGVKATVHDLHQALSDALAVATLDDQVAHRRRSRAQERVECTTRDRVASASALAAFEALHA